MFAILISLAIGFQAHAGAGKSDVEVHEPATKAVATVIFLHGGAWLGGDKADAAAWAPTFTSKSVRFISANYRLAPAFKHPAPIEDLDSILSRGHYENVFLIGHSAGAHLIAFWSATHKNSSVKGAIGVEGIYDLSKLVKVWPTYKGWFIAKEFGDDESKYGAASPAQLKATSQVSWLLIHSPKDELVDIAQSQDFFDHLKSEKVPARFLVLKEGSHFGAINALKDSSSEISKATLEFILSKH